MRVKRHWTRGQLIANGIAVAFVLFVVAALWPVYNRAMEASRKSSCENNMKELGTAITLYVQDYGEYPSSILLAPKSPWDAGTFKQYATRGWVSFVQPYIKNQEIIWCPSDPLRRRKSSGGIGTSFFWKAAVDRAWFGGEDENGKWSCRKEADFQYPADQMIFYERASWHWSEAHKGLSEDVALSFLFVDGHVSVFLIKQAGNDFGNSDAAALGEPAWYNYDFEHNKRLTRDENFDARSMGDKLR